MLQVSCLFTFIWCSLLRVIINTKYLNFKYVKNSVGALRFGIRRLLGIVNSIVFLPTNLYGYLTEYQVFDCVAVLFCVVGKSPIHLSLAIPPETCRIRSNRKVNRETSFSLMVYSFLCLLFSPGSCTKS